MCETTGPFSPKATVYHDESTHALNPPSSPPGFPWEKQDALGSSTNTPPTSEVSAFSLLGKRKALEGISDNARSTKKIAASSAKSACRGLTQLQISLGQKVQTKCKTCGMEYVPSLPEDRRLHDQYHKQSTEGCDVGKDFVKKVRIVNVFNVAQSGDKICALNCCDKFSTKKRAQAVLEVVQRELGAVPIPEDDIWNCGNTRTLLPEGRRKFEVYMYIRRSKCVGLLLVQSIKEANRIVEPESSCEHDVKVEASEEPQQSDVKGALLALKARQRAEIEKREQQEKLPLQLSKETYPARLGICRIWTSPLHRHQAIATKLLDTAVKYYNQDACVSTSSFKGDKLRAPELWSPYTRVRVKSKDVVAFSQPTEAGTRLARRWFGKMFGWNVYVD